jgi:hypothetical protein
VQYGDTFYNTNYRTLPGSQLIQPIRKNYTDAIKSLGSNAAPFLVEQLVWDHSSWRRFLAWAGRSSGYFQLDDKDRYRRKMAAQIGFNILKTNAVSALPALEKVLYDGALAEEVASVLPSLGPAAFPVMTNALTKGQPATQIAVARHVFEFRHRDVGALLLSLLKTGTLDVQVEVIGLLCPMGITFEETKELLKQSLNHAEPRMQLATLNALICYGRDAVTLIPDIRAIPSPSPDVSRVAKTTLEALEKSREQK